MLAYVKRHGRPVAFYSDKHSIFRVHAEGATGRSHGMSQFGRALAQLNIDIICANSRPAKGRVERAHKTLQDRLVNELRLPDVADLDAGKARRGIRGSPCRGRASPGLCCRTPVQ